LVDTNLPCVVSAGNRQHLLTMFDPQLSTSARTSPGKSTMPSRKNK
jgi:hypothetical protein